MALSRWHSDYVCFLMTVWKGGSAESVCKVCNFEIVYVTEHSGKSYNLCPFCFNSPPFEGMTRGESSQRCTARDSRRVTNVMQPLRSR